MKVLLTGATGFIGAHVARVLLEHGHEVHALVRWTSSLSRLTDVQDRLHFIRADILELPSVTSDSPFNCCIHLAWYVEPGKYVDLSINRDYQRASLSLATMLRTNGCQRIIAAGTCYEYDLAAVAAGADRGGPQGPQGPRSPRAATEIAESHPTGPVTLYGQSKLKLLETLQLLAIETAWPRLFYQYGPHEDSRRLVPYIIQSLLRGQPAELTPGEQVRDFLHVEDVARAIVAVAESDITGAVNIGSGEPITVRQLAEKIGALIGRTDLLKFGVRPYPPGDPMRVVADNTRLRQTGWQPRYNLDTGLRQTIDWWKSQQP